MLLMVENEDVQRCEFYWHTFIQTASQMVKFLYGEGQRGNEALWCEGSQWTSRCLHKQPLSYPLVWNCNQPLAMSFWVTMRPYRSEIRTDVISRWDGLWSIAISTASTTIWKKKKYFKLVIKYQKAYVYQTIGHAVKHVQSINIYTLEN
jgi:hypothetical protein